MDPLRFDDLTRRLAHGTSRRQVLKGLGAALAGALAVGVQPAAADNTCKPSGHLPQSKCNKGAQCCSGVCSQGQCCTPLTVASCTMDVCGTTISDTCGGTITCPACPTTTTTTTTAAPVCVGADGSCSSDTQCCSGNCCNGQCCSGICCAGMCCSTAPNLCCPLSLCCGAGSTFCTPFGKCCIPTGDAGCKYNEDCCSGTCNASTQMCA